MITSISTGRARALGALLTCSLWSSLWSGIVVAQDSLADAKRAYAAAEYEQALKTLEPLDSPEARQYTALCLLALGRADAAARTIEAMVTASPLFTPSSDDVPPRFVTLVADTRRKILPAAARKAFAEGRDRFNAKQVADAMPHFELALKIADDPLWRGSPDAEDLRTLAEGFTQLARAAAPPPAPATDASGPDAAPTAVGTSGGRIRQSTTSQKVTLPVAIKQDLPALPQNLLRTAGPVAIMRLIIGADGKVVSATVEQSAHPRYDEMLIQAASTWEYEPGTMDGKPVMSEKTLRLQLR